MTQRATSKSTRDFLGYGRAYPRVDWPGKARLAVCVVVHFEEGAERSPLYGDDLSEGVDPDSGSDGASTEGSERDLQVESIWEYGARRGVWRILDILERFGVRATFSCCGQALERNPKVAQAIVRRGHEVAAQGYRFVSYAGLDVETERREHARAVAAIEGVTGVRPRGWSSRIPSVNTRALLMENGQFLYDSDSYADDLPYFVHADTGRLLIIPHSFDLNDRKFSPPPSVAGFGSAKNFTSALRASFDRLYAEGVEHPQMMSIGLHPRLSGRPMRAAAFGTFLEYATSVRRVWFAPRLDIANYWIRLSRGGTSSGHVEEWR